LEILFPADIAEMTR